MPLANLSDYQARHGSVSDVDQATVTQLLADASSLVREIAHTPISEETATVTLEGNGQRRLLLPHLPVTAVSVVSVDGDTVDLDDVRWWDWGGVDRRSGVWPRGEPVAVTYTSGWDPVPDWIVNVVCSMVFESLRDQVVTGEQSITTGSQTISYFAARSNMFVPANDKDRLLAIRGPL